MKIDYFKIPEIKVSYKDTVKTSERFQIKCSEDVIKIFKVAFEECMQHHEESYVIYLNRSNKVLGISNISKCGVASTIVDVKIIMQTALKVHASGIILSHNHPSSNSRPSMQDMTLTENIKSACKLLDITFLDHIIMTDEDYYSFASEGRL
ncbi:JAB domain-containing protein [Bacteroidales bacterium OttesenSCG-928-K03]|nr:JAB domain-containing protein [Odoribacter sp. OttesenSCG-928-L07]MDL2239921.1 JAB domain-containing protein [Bacteroidales bacterium OttesenSCG-928-L14]MDL2240162.1 JAB domain-containing protein [Bacteroidales bacterium OttesenSCG-928-K22]MDL2242483.1 JAB domain-containing protein [Bacteroidales bacterium OttesenSCG-928-K03]